MSSTSQFPAIVVGAGPVGLSVALGLLRQGHAVLVFEQRPKLAIDPRATTIQPPTLEMLRELGVFDDVVALGRKVHHLQYWNWEPHRVEKLADLPLLHLADHTPVPWRLHCAQPDLCDVLYRAVEELMPGAVHLAHKVIGFKDLGDCVDVEVEGPGGKRRIRGSWLVAADGTRSAVRKQLELPMRRLTRPDAFFTCETGLGIDDAIEQHFQVRLGDAAFTFTPHGWALFMRLPDSVRLLFMASSGTAEAMSTEALWGMTRDLFGADERVEVLHRAVYTVQQQVAERWLQGRVMVLGDAAHSTFPVSGTAMNSGMHDGFLLAKALDRDAEGVRAWADERRDAIHGRVSAQANDTYKALNANGMFSRFTRDRYLRRLARDPAAARDHLLRASMMEGRAGPVPELRDDRATT